MWFITAFNKMGKGSAHYDVPNNWWTYGFYFDKEKAIQALHENHFHIHENGYDYAVIEEFIEGICNYTGNHQWFKWSEERGGFFEINDPDAVKQFCGFAFK